MVKKKIRVEIFPRSNIYVSSILLIMHYLIYCYKYLIQNLSLVTRVLLWQSPKNPGWVYSDAYDMLVQHIHKYCTKFWFFDLIYFLSSKWDLFYFGPLIYLKSSKSLTKCICSEKWPHISRPPVFPHDWTFLINDFERNLFACQYFDPSLNNSLAAY